MSIFKVKKKQYLPYTTLEPRTVKTHNVSKVPNKIGKVILAVFLKNIMCLSTNEDKSTLDFFCLLHFSAVVG